MKRLGIAIKSTLQGSGEAIKVNPGPWEKRIVDIRDVLRHVPSLSSDPNRSVVFVSFSDAGSYVTVARCFPNRPGDNIAGWIFIPNDILIMGDEVCHAVDEVRNIIFMSELPARGKLEETFSKAFPLKPASIPTKPSPKNGKFAKREITSDTPLDVLLGSAIYQPGYNNYQDIFLVQYKDEVMDAVDITAQPLTQMITLQPPTQEALANAGQGVLIYFAKTNEPFSRPIMVPKGTRVELKAIRRGFSSEMFAIKAEGDMSHCPLPQFMWKPSREMPQEAAPTPDLPTWEVELANGQYGQIMVKGRGVSRNSSPLKGYELVSRKSLAYKGGGWKDRFIGFGAAILLGLVVCGILALSGTFDSHKGKGESAENVDENGFPTPGDNADFSTIDAAIAYLDGTKNWDRSNMENYTQLQGLYDDLNDFNLTKIINTWSNKLSKSSTFQSLVAAANKCRENNWPAKANGSKFEPGEGSINVDRYIDWIGGGCANAKSTPVENNYQPSTPKESTGPHYSTKPTTPKPTPSPRPNPSTTKPAVQKPATPKPAAPKPASPSVDAKKTTKPTDNGTAVKKGSVTRKTSE